MMLAYERLQLLHHLGNVGCCGAPSVLSMNWDNIQPGDDIAMVIVGAGLAWAYAMLKVENSK